MIEFEMYRHSLKQVNEIYENYKKSVAASSRRKPFLYNWAKSKLSHKGMTMAELAKAIGINRVNLSKILNGKYTIAKHQLIAICYILDCTEEIEGLWGKIEPEHKRRIDK